MRTVSDADRRFRADSQFTVVTSGKLIHNTHQAITRLRVLIPLVLEFSLLFPDLDSPALMATY
jgi:hypothetical protein